MPQDLWTRMREGAVHGLLFATGYSLLAAIPYTLRPEHVSNTLGITYPLLVVVYFVGGAVTGGFVGAVAPWGRSVLGRILIGVVAATPVSFCLALLVVPAADGYLVVPTALVTAALIGGAIGASWSVT